MRHARLALGLTLTITSAASLRGQAALRAMPSGRATAEVSLALPRDAAPVGAQPATIRLDYGQPHLRGRPLHTDSLVPYDKPWRTGANAATTLETGVDLLIGGASVPKGKYVLYTLPSRAGWKLIVQRDAGQPGTEYDAAHDVARIDLRHHALATPLESLTMWLIPQTGPGPARGELRLAWGTSALATNWSVR
jgi:hypothetical protein